jgi:hypothetical protein
MQFTGFPNRGATGITGNGNELFRGEFFAFHWKMMQQLTGLGMSNIAHLSKALSVCSMSCKGSEQKGTSLSGGGVRIFK